MPVPCGPCPLSDAVSLSADDTLTIPVGALTAGVTHTVNVTVSACGEAASAHTDLLYYAPPSLASGSGLQVAGPVDLAGLTAATSLPLSAGAWTGEGVLLYSFGYQTPTGPKIVVAGPRTSSTANVYPPYVAAAQQVTFFMDVSDRWGTSTSTLVLMVSPVVESQVRSVRVSTQGVSGGVRCGVGEAPVGRPPPEGNRLRLEGARWWFESTRHVWESIPGHSPHGRHASA